MHVRVNDSNIQGSDDEFSNLITDKPIRHDVENQDQEQGDAMGYDKAQAVFMTPNVDSKKPKSRFFQMTNSEAA